MVATTIELPVELRRALAAAARESGRDEVEIVREAIEAFLGAQGRPRPVRPGWLMILGWMDAIPRIGCGRTGARSDHARYVRPLWLPQPARYGKTGSGSS